MLATDSSKVPSYTNRTGWSRAIMRVLHLVPALFGASGGLFGGAERYVYELARFMAQKTPVSLLTFGDHDETRHDGNLRIRVLGQPRHVAGQRLNPWHWAVVGEVLKADIIHCHQTHILASSLAAIVSRMTRRKVYTSDLGGGGWDLSGYISTDHWFHGHLHISEYSRKVFQHDQYPRAHVIMGGVDTVKFAPAPAASSARGNGRVLFVGRLMPHKGIDVLIQALPPGLSLDIIGRPYHSEYCVHLRQLAQDKPIRFLENCEDAEIVAAYQSSLGIVLPSVYLDCYGHKSSMPELLGQTLLEGMACGVPGICSKVASMPEIVEDGTSGFVVPERDAATLGGKLAWLRDHPCERAEMGRAARQRVLNNFTWPRVVDRCLQVYQSSC